MKLIKQFLTIGMLGLLSLQANAMTFGFSYHPQGESALDVANFLKSKGSTHIRLDINKSDFNNFTNFVKVLNQNGILVTAVINTDTAWKVKKQFNMQISGVPHPVNYTTPCPGDNKDVQDNAYDDAYNQINGLKDYVQYFEMENEITLYKDLTDTIFTMYKVQPPGGATAASFYSNPSNFGSVCADTMAAVLRGITTAMSTVKQNPNYSNLKTILGITSSGDTGFLAYMLNTKLIPFDIVGGHIYPKLNDSSLNNDPWFGPNGYIGLLKTFGKKIHINEFNCGEIYGDSPLPFINTNGSTSMNQCSLSLQKHLPEILSQDNYIEVLDAFEIKDEPTACLTPGDTGRNGAECRFGYLFNNGTVLNSPKQILTDYTNAITTYKNSKDDTMFITLPNGAVITF
ncbi:hypothetical protein ACMYR3_05735 [Ampullimonas aquatilis]|uniref:hypothetical protein n=1 Tax=Ampullimonas aquatilis TaxID=1341549 RepID=UPI003C77186D